MRYDRALPRKHAGQSSAGLQEDPKRNGKCKRSNVSDLTLAPMSLHRWSGQIEDIWRGIIAPSLRLAQKRSVNIVHLAGFVIASAQDQMSFSDIRLQPPVGLGLKTAGKRARLCAQQRHSVAAGTAPARVDGMLVFSKGLGIGCRERLTRGCVTGTWQRPPQNSNMTSTAAVAATRST